MDIDNTTSINNIIINTKNINIPVNICWSSRHVLKTSSTRLQRNIFSS